ncbi:MAG: hypothetical protein LBL09_02450 [Oscillospiraceae bacterium]|jgi:hypothetical protein|nr:hypothetical protein [Oscillospiraceae bacterium]
MNKKPIVKHSKKLYILLVCLGLALMAAGAIAEQSSFASGLPGRFLGFGAGLGSAAAALGSVGLILLRRKPEDARQQEINENDERFIKIREKSAQSTWYVTLTSLLALEFVFLFLDYMIPCFIVIGVMAVHVISYFAFLYRNSKKL